MPTGSRCVCCSACQLRGQVLSSAQDKPNASHRFQSKPAKQHAHRACTCQGTHSRKQHISCSTPSLTPSIMTFVDAVLICAASSTLPPTIARSSQLMNSRCLQAGTRHQLRRHPIAACGETKKTTLARLACALAKQTKSTANISNDSILA